MNKATKLREAMKNHPIGWQIDDLQVVARQHGITWRHDGGSHCVFIRPVRISRHRGHRFQTIVGSHFKRSWALISRNRG
ncbi:hypothetical protein, partial [Acidithiobacillus ferrivorans]|uniref:hypothetical protein n=1 Tax=Acidithiobacillus ferrivorans TaxID=160808 RepID=UPI001C400100